MYVVGKCILTGRQGGGRQDDGLIEIWMSWKLNGMEMTFLQFPAVARSTELLVSC
jgi:hypothetical protein